MKVVLTITAALLLVSTAAADVRSKAAQEAAEAVTKLFARETAQTGAAALARRIETYAAKHGDEFLSAVRRVGPRAFQIADDAGPEAARAIRILSRHGDEGAWLLSRPGAKALVANHGEDVAKALIQHKAVAEPLVEKFGANAARALENVTPQNGRRIAMLADGGELHALGRADQVLTVIAKHGDGACDFIWKHKGALATATALAAFLVEPEPFINGTKSLVSEVTQTTVTEVAHAASEVAQTATVAAVKPVAEGVARRTNWTLVILAGIAGAVAIVWRKFGVLIARRVIRRLRVKPEVRNEPRTPTA